MLILHLIHLVAGGVTLGDKSLYDPGVLTWSETTWSISPIALSESNAGSTVSFTFSFHTFTSLSSGVFCVDLPTGFSSDTLCDSITNYVSDTDYSVTINDIDLPSTSGPYGPFTIYTATSESGKIIDINPNFGTIWVYDSYTNNTDGLTLTLGSSEVNADTEIIFSFDVKQPLSKADLFKISVPSYFTVNTLACKSQSSDYLAGSSSDISKINCEYSDGTITINGNTKEIPASDSAPITLAVQISLFTNPASVISTSSLQWTLKTIKFGTNQVLEVFTVSGPLLTYKELAIKSWEPAVTKSLTTGCNGYMVLTFTIDIEIPSNGNLLFTFTNADLAELAWKSTASQSTSSGTKGFCSLDSSIEAECELSSGTILSCTPTSAILQGDYTLTTFPKFSSTSATVVISTSDDKTNSLQVSADYELSYSSAELLTSAKILFSTSNTGAYSAYSNTNLIMYFSLVSTVDLAVGDSIKLSLPIGGTSTYNTLFGITGSLKANSLIKDSVTNSYAIETLTQNNDPVVSGTTITVKMVQSAVAGKYIYIYFSSDNGAASPAITLPKVESNTVTLYEFSVSLTVSDTEYVYAGPITVIAKEFTSASGVLLCSSSVAGVPFAVSLKTSYGFTLTTGLYIAVEFTGYDEDLSSGLSNGDTYPVDTSLTTVTFVLQSNSVRMNGLTTISASNTFDFTFPIGAGSTDSTDSYSATAKVFYLVSGVEHVIMANDLDYDLNTLGTKHFSEITAETYQDSSQITPKVNSEFSLKFKVKYSSTYSSGYLGVILPPGFTFNSPSVSLFSSSSTEATILYYYSSGDFNYPSVYFSLDSNFVINSAGVYFRLSGIVGPLGSLTDEVKFILTPSDNTECVRVDAASLPEITIGPLSFTKTTFTPTSIKASGPGYILSTVTASLTLPIEIPADSAIAFTSAWEISDLYSYSLSGVTSFTFAKSSDTLTFTKISKISNAATIILTIKNVENPDEDGDEFQFSSIKVFTDSTLANAIVQYTGTDGVSISSASNTGISHFSSAAVLPNGVGLVADIVYLKFTLDNSLPIGSQILIDSPTGEWYRSGNIKYYCHTSFYYSSCEISDDNLIITISEAYTEGNSLEILLDQCLELPSKSGNTDAGFTVTTKYGDTIIDQDTSSAPSSFQKVNIEALPSETIIQLSSVEISPSNIGEYATYSFNFSCEAIISMTYTLYFSFPRNFDPYLGGKRTFKNSNPNSFYVDCSSTTENMTDIECFVDHWMVGVTGFSSSVSNGTEILIQLFNIKTPESVGEIGVYVISRNSKLIAYTQNMVSDSVTSMGTNVLIVDLTASNSYLRESSEYTLNVYLNTFYEDSLITIEFPTEFNIPRDNSNKGDCSGDSATVTLSGACYFDSNTLYIPTGVSFEGYELFTISFTVQNPEWGEEDLENVFSIQSFDYWMRPLGVGVKTGLVYSERTYGQNPGYTGFFELKKLVNINGFSPIGNQNNLNLKPGIQLIDLEISVDVPFSAISLILTPKNSDINKATLYFSSSYNFTMTKDITTISFTVSTPSNSENSINYIEWTIEETTYNGTSLYSVDAKTMVEVYDTSDIELTLSVDGSSICYLPKEVWGPYIVVTTPYPPYSDLTLSISLLDSSLEGVNFEPSSITFLPNETKKYIRMYLNDTFSSTNTSGPFEYTFTQTGADNTAYSQIGVSVFYQDDNLEYYIPTINTLAFSSVQKNSLDVVIEVNETSEVYWEFCDNETPFSSYADLAKKVYPLTGSDSTNIKLEDQISEYLLGIRTSQYSNENWAAFQKNMLKYSKGTCFYSTDLIPASEETTIFSPFFLWAETTYKVQAYAHSLKSEYSDSNYSESTLSVPSSVEIKLSISSANSLKADSVTTAISQSLSVPSGRLDLKSSTRRQLISEMTWVLNTDRSSPTSPENLYSDLDKELFSSLIKLSAFSISSTTLKSSDYILPSGDWAVSETSLSYVIVEGEYTGDGQLCCIGEVYPLSDYELSGTQVFLGIDRANENTMSNCTDFTGNWTLVINGLSADTDYLISCVYASGFPVWPELSEITEMNVTTLISETIFETDFGLIIKSSLVLLLLI